MSETLRGIEIVLAGGTGGLGSETAHLLAAEGARLIVGYKSDSARAAALAGIATLVQADLTVAEDRARLLAARPRSRPRGFLGAARAQ